MLPSPSGKEVEVRGSGSWHHQLCGCCNLQLIQSHMAPSHGPPARILSPLFFPAKSLLLPKLHGKNEHPKTTWSSLLSFRTAWSSSFPLHSPIHSRTVWPPIYFRTSWSSSFAAPFPTPPTVSYTCLHPRILPALLGCHSKFG